MKKYIEEFIKLTSEKMANEISDMTYQYNATEVPKTHYKKILETETLELIAQDSTIECVLLNAVVGQLETLQKESPRIFVKALLCMELNIKPKNINQRIYDSLELTTSKIMSNKKCSLFKDEIIETYQDYYSIHSQLRKENTNENNENETLN